MNTQKRYVEESLLMGGCPECGAEVNREFVEDTIDRIVARAKKEAFEEGVKAERERVVSNLPKVITPNIEPPKNSLSQNQIFASGQANMLMRVLELLLR
jgi:threonine synthase